MGDRAGAERGVPARDAAERPPSRVSSRRGSVQAKLVVGPADDPYEREADELAAAVMRAIAHPVPHDPLDDLTSPRIQRRSTGAVVGLDGGELDADTDTAIRHATGDGRPLDTKIRASMEAGFGADFSAVRVHTGTNADRLNHRIQAKAFTTGSDIFFANGHYDPHTRTGQHLLAHELTHVLQQGGAIARTTARPATDDVTVDEQTRSSGRSTITLRGTGGELGSVDVTPTGTGTVEATNLSVRPDQRGNGYGQQLVAAAARVGARTGHSGVTLASQDDGTGRLDQWYRSLGFRKTGANTKGHTTFHAPTHGLQRAPLGSTGTPDPRAPTREPRPSLPRRAGVTARQLDASGRSPRVQRMEDPGPAKKEAAKSKEDSSTSKEDAAIALLDKAKRIRDQVKKMRKQGATGANAGNNRSPGWDVEGGNTTEIVVRRPKGVSLRDLVQAIRARIESTRLNAELDQSDSGLLKIRFRQADGNILVHFQVRE